ncbi:MAG: ROK family transcriptional regulator [Actinobacteria bacterium]|nr:ROK family transcriptional regulator [Actinomycetota bacterium]
MKSSATGGAETPETFGEPSAAIGRAAPALTSTSQVRLYKRTRILHALRRNPGLSKIGLARELDISPTTVGSLVEGLVRDGIVVATGLEPSMGGRPPERLSLDPEGPLALGVDLGETAARFGLLDLAGRLVATETLPFRRRPQEGAVDTGIVSDGITALLAETGLSDRIAGIGVAVPGLVDREAGAVRYAANLGWQDVALAGQLALEFDRPVLVDRNTNAALLAEEWWGTAAEEDPAIFVTLGSGIGAAIRVDGEFVRGASGAPGEFGHIPIVADGPECRCGQRGCLEALASSAAVQRSYQRLASAAPDGGISAVVQAAREGDPLALHVLDEAARHLGIGIATIVNLFNPSVVILGGELMEAADLILARIDAQVRARSLKVSSAALRLVSSSFHGDAALIGAATIAFDALFNHAFRYRAGAAAAVARPSRQKAKA